MSVVHFLPSVAVWLKHQAASPLNHVKDGYNPTPKKYLLTP